MYQAGRILMHFVFRPSLISTRGHMEWLTKPHVCVSTLCVKMNLSGVAFLRTHSSCWVMKDCIMFFPREENNIQVWVGGRRGASPVLCSECSPKSMHWRQSPARQCAAQPEVLGPWEESSAVDSCPTGGLRLWVRSFGLPSPLSAPQVTQRNGPHQTMALWHRTF